MKDIKTKNLFISVLILAVLIVSLLAFWKKWSFNNQTYGIYTQEAINHTREMVKDNKQPYVKAQQQLLSLADKALGNEVQTSSFLRIPPAYKDGEGHSRASKNITESAYDAYVLSVAWKLTDKAKYKTKAEDILNTWAKNNRLISHKDDTPLVSAYGGVGFIYAALLLKDDEEWNQTDFRKWVKVNYLPAVKVARDRENNWADWGNLASLASYSYLDDQDKFDKEVKYTKHLINTQIGVDGEMLKETSRQEKSMIYTYFALAPLTQSIDFIYNQSEINLFNIDTKEGTKVQRALDNFYYYVENPDEWPYYTKGDLAKPLTKSTNNLWPLNLYEAMSTIYPNKGYDKLVTGYRPVLGGYIINKGPHHLAWGFPTLIRTEF
ncbi:alginate lyase family protein [Priestia aryabhattai]|uniref:alginate lyase family protein n=1 Tax=Priestia aryabhattai TaxID=412384 RepID=UPI003D2BF703